MTLHILISMCGLLLMVYSRMLGKFLWENRIGKGTFLDNFPWFPSFNVFVIGLIMLVGGLMNLYELNF